MGSHRPSRYAGSRRPVTRSITNIRRTDKERQSKIRELDKQLNEFMKEPYGYLKIRKVYNMYSKLDVLDSLSSEWYSKFENQIPENVRPSSVISKSEEDGIHVNMDRTLSLRSLIVAFGHRAAPLVKFAIKNKLTEKMKFFVAVGDIVKDRRTSNVVSVDHSWDCSLGNVPMLALATAVAIENKIAQVAGFDDILFDNPDDANMLEYFKYRYPELLEERRNS